MIQVIATITTRPGCREGVLAAIRDNLAAVRGEAGCLGYTPTVDLASGLPAQGPCREETITLVEAWESLEALLVHLRAPHMATYRDKVKDWVSGVALQVLTPAD